MFHLALSAARAWELALREQTHSVISTVAKDPESVQKDGRVRVFSDERPLRSGKKKMIVICACSPRPTETFCSALLRCKHILGQWIPRKEPKSPSRIYSRPCGNIKNIGVTVGPHLPSAAMKTVIFSEPALVSDSHEVTTSLNSNVQVSFLAHFIRRYGFCLLHACQYCLGLHIPSGKVHLKRQLLLQHLIIRIIVSQAFSDQMKTRWLHLTNPSGKGPIEHVECRKNRQEQFAASCWCKGWQARVLWQNPVKSKGKAALMLKCHAMQLLPGIQRMTGNALKILSAP